VTADIAATVSVVAQAPTWDARVQRLRQVPEAFGLAHQARVYSAIAEQVYKPELSPMFAHLPWRQEYELGPFAETYREVDERTAGFTKVEDADLRDLLLQSPRALRVLRMLLGYTADELAAAVTIYLTEQDSTQRVGKGRILGLERGQKPTAELAAAVAQTVNRLVTGVMWGEAEEPLRPKLSKPDTEDGWRSVQRFAREGVPFEVYLHQRFYGGAFGQLLNATSSIRGDLLELPVKELFDENGILYVRTGASDQAEIEARFGLTVRPAPDFVVFDENDALRAMLECKQTNDGGTARDKAGRFLTLREEGTRLGGVPVFAVVDGLGWRRTGDALGPVVRYTDGRVFTLANVGDLITTQPFPLLRRTTTA
jgi:transcriptional regulator with XRE-family HTH domain